MVVRIRLARFGRRNQPFYNIVIAHASKPLEVIGTYDPIPREDPYDDSGKRRHKDIQLDMARAKYWIGVGAQPSDTMWRLLALAGLMPPKKRGSPSAFTSTAQPPPQSTSTSTSTSTASTPPAS